MRKTVKTEIRKLMIDRKKKLQGLMKENATKEEIRDALKDIDEELGPLLKSNAAGLQELHYYHVGEAQALFYVQKDHKWYKVATPPPPVEGQLLYQ
jgi:hypothetical protein